MNTLDSYIEENIGPFLRKNGAWVDIFPTEYSLGGVPQLYVLRVRKYTPEREILWYKDLYRTQVSRYDFHNQTWLWDDIVEEIQLVLTFSG
jgi:hypothetical protein